MKADKIDKSNIISRFDELKTTKKIKLENKKSKEEKLQSKKNKYNDLVKARWVLSEVVELTQNKFKKNIEIKKI